MEWEENADKCAIHILFHLKNYGGCMTYSKSTYINYLGFNFYVIGSVMPHICHGPAVSCIKTRPRGVTVVL